MEEEGYLTNEQSVESCNLRSFPYAENIDEAYKKIHEFKNAVYVFLHDVDDNGI